MLGCGHQLQYEQAQALLDSNASITGLNYNHTTASVFFDYNCPTSNTTSTGYKCLVPGRHQVWYDSPGSLAVKMGYLRALGIRGIGCWETGASVPVASLQQPLVWSRISSTRSRASWEPATAATTTLSDL